MSQNDETTHASIKNVSDQIATLFSHFQSPEATWDSFGKADIYVELLKLRLQQLTLCVETELQARAAVEPTDYGV